MDSDFVSSFLMILVSEIGDKTFLIACLMAMRHSRILIFCAAFGALGAMTLLSAILGHTFTHLLPQASTDGLAAFLFFVFGIKMFKEAAEIEPGSEAVNTEIQSLQREIDQGLESKLCDEDDDIEVGKSHNDPVGDAALPYVNRTYKGVSKQLSKKVFNLASLLLSPVFVETFVLTFLGEWGDRSQVTTIAMSAEENIWPIVLGASFGHFVCTLIAVLGGKLLAGRISVKTVTISGAIFFVIFGVIYGYRSINHLTGNAAVEI